MTFRRLLPIIIILAVLGGVAALIYGIANPSDPSDEYTDDDVEYDYGEYSKEIVVDESTEVTGDLAEYVSIVPGTYELKYVSEKEANYGKQEYMITLKIKLKKQYPYDVYYSQKLKFLTSRGTIGKLEMELSRGSLDRSELEKFESFVKEGKEGDVKEFMFYNSLRNRGYADSNFKLAEKLTFETIGSGPSQVSSSSSSSETGTTTATSSASSSSTATTSSEPVATAAQSDSEDEGDSSIDIELDEYESYVEQYRECSDKKSPEAFELLTQA